MSIQVCIVTIAGYGPWTLKLGSDREHKLQSLQASLYGALQDEFSKQNGLVFQNRSDELFVLCGGMSMDSHITVIENIRTRFPDICLDASVGCADDPFSASKEAYEASSLANTKQSVYGQTCDDTSQTVIMHMDVDGLSVLRKKMSPYEITSTIYGLYAKMSSFFMERASLAFFMGGDNFMISANAKSATSDATEFLKIAKSQGIILNCGIGRASNARMAASGATRSLDAIRAMRDNGNTIHVYEAKD